jgi:chromosomal replication initiator protein
MEDSEVVAALSAQLAERIGPERFEMWFNTRARLHVEAERLVISTPDVLLRNWLQKKFGGEVRAWWKSVAGDAGTVEFVLRAEYGNGDGNAAPVSAVQAQAAAGAAVGVENNRPSAVAERNVSPRPDLSLTNKAKSVTKATARNVTELSKFVVGPGNEYAFRAADLTGRGRQQASPLLLCGPTGVGKTHLLKGILHEYRRYHPRAAAAYLSAEDFTNGFLQALHGGGLPSFRQKCRGARLLAIDDLQFFVGKQRTLEELLQTIDAMTADGRQIVLSSDRGLADLRALGPELVSRLAGGLICEIEPPEFATRVGIFRQLRDEAGLTIDDAVLSLVAQRVTEGARELKGALLRLEAMSDAFGDPISLDLAERALGDMARHTTRPVRLADVESAVCEVFGIERDQLRSERKGRTVSEPRMLAMWLARKYTRAPWSEIGEYFGRRSHSTVISAHRRVEKLITENAQIGVADRTCNVEDAIRRVETRLRTA